MVQGSPPIETSLLKERYNSWLYFSGFELTSFQTYTKPGVVLRRCRSMMPTPAAYQQLVLKDKERIPRNRSDLGKNKRRVPAQCCISYRFMILVYFLIGGWTLARAVVMEAVS